MRLVAFLIAVAGGFLLNEALLPSVVVPNEILAVLGWGVVLCSVPALVVDARVLRAAMAPLLVLALLAGACGLSMAMGGLPRTPGLPELGVLGMAAVLVVHGAQVARHSPTVFRSFAMALLVAGVLGSVIGILQIFAPSALDNRLAAFLVWPGRATGNLGQANHFADTQIWGLLGLAMLSLSPASTRTRAGFAASIGLALLLVLGVALSGSRTALVSLFLLAGWGLVDRQLTRVARIALVAAPVAGILLTLAVSALTGAAPTARPTSDLTAFRADIWADSWRLIQAQPWFGVGWGEFNFAWVLTPIAWRPAGFFDNAHNLVLHLAVEIGIPLAAAVLGLLLWGVWRPLRRMPKLGDERGLAARCALMMVLVIGLHSMLEYPLWYAFFLLPTAWAWGFALGSAQAPAAEAAVSGADDQTAVPHRGWRLAGAVFIVCGAGAWLDYGTIARLYMPGPADASISERLARAQASPLFRHYGDLALALQVEHPAEVLPQIEQAARANLDGRLLYTWANALEATGEDDKARYLAARLREFKLPGAAPFFAACADASSASAKPWQCQPPSAGLTWRSFRR